jgi:hypothetical protein
VQSQNHACNVLLLLDGFALPAETNVIKRSNVSLGRPQLSGAWGGCMTLQSDKTVLYYSIDPIYLRIILIKALVGPGPGP